MSERATTLATDASLASGRAVISGVAIGVGDTTRGLSGDRKVWRADALREAAQSLEDVDVTALHSDATVGEVVDAGFQEGVGVVYEAELDDEALAERVRENSLEVSIEARHTDGGAVDTPEGEAMAAADIEFTGMALVQTGAAPSATAEPGEAAALANLKARVLLKEQRVAELEARRDELREERNEVARAYAEALTTDDGSVLTPEDLMEMFTVDELRNRLEQHHASVRRHAPVSPPEPDIQSGNVSTSASHETATLTDSDRGEVARLRERLDDLEGKDRPLARHARREIADRLEDLTGNRPDVDDSADGGA